MSSRVPKVPRGGDGGRVADAINRVTRPTRKFSMGSAGTRTFTVPVDGSATTAGNTQLIRALLEVLADKGIVTLEET